MTALSQQMARWDSLSKRKAKMTSEHVSDWATAPGPQQIARSDSKQAESQDDSYFPSKWPDKTKSKREAKWHLFPSRWPDETVSKRKAKMAALSQQMARWDSKQAESQKDNSFPADGEMRQ